MQNGRRKFVKNVAIVTAGTVAGATVLNATSSETPVQGASNNGVVKGSSTKREILYTKTATWEEYYKNAK